MATPSKADLVELLREFAYFESNSVRGVVRMRLLQERAKEALRLNDLITRPPEKRQ